MRRMMASALGYSWAVWWGVVCGEDWIGKMPGWAGVGCARGEEIERKRKGGWATVAGQLGCTRENKKGAGWAWFKGEKENGPGPGLSIENTFLFSNLL
jgi:hypothetical protein